MTDAKHRFQGMRKNGKKRIFSDLIANKRELNEGKHLKAIGFVVEIREKRVITVV